MSNEKDQKGATGENQETKTGADDKSKKGAVNEGKKPDEDTPVNLAKKSPDGTSVEGNYMWIKGTGKSKHLKKGAVERVQKAHGDYLISRDLAEKTEAPVEKKKDKK